jgi:hypothetical protein
MMYLKQFPDICREMGFDVENHICADSKNCPSSTTGWCEWLGNNWNSMT